MLRKRVARTLLTLIAIAALAACGGAQSRFANHMARGQQYYSQDNFAKAAIEFRNALQISPNDPQARYMAGRVAEQVGNIRGAAAAYQSVVEMAPGFVPARAGLGRLYVLGGAAQRAVDTIAPALAQHADDAALLTVRAAARMQLGDRDGALQDAERAVHLAPEDDDAAATLAAVYSQLRDPAHAIAFLAPVVASRPGSIGLHQVLAELYESGGDSARAEHELQEVVRLRPRDCAQRQHLADWEVHAKRLDEAERVLGDAISACDDPDAARFAYLNFLTTYRSTARAEKALEEFAAHEPDNYGLQLELAAVQQRRGATDTAAQTLEHIIDKAGELPQGLTARSRLAGIRLEQDREAEALALIRQVLEKSPRDTDALSLRAQSELRHGDATAAIVDLRAVVKDQPNSVQAARALATAYVANNQTSLAEETLRAGVQANPADVWLRADLARLYVSSQRVDEAIDLLRQGVQVSPNNAALREALVDVYLHHQDLEAARVAAEELEKQRPDAAVGPYLAGVVAVTQKRYDDAERDFDRALQLQPSAMDALSRLVRLEFSRGRKQQALARCAAAIAREPDNALAHNLMGELFVDDKDFPSANEQFAQAIRLAPKWPAPYRNLAISKLASGDASGGMSAYEAGIKATAYDPDLVSALATLYLVQNRVDDAIRLYESLHAQQPQLAMAANNLAVLLVSYKADSDSLKRARLLSGGFASSSDAALLDTNGWVHFKSGEYADALPVLERASALAPASHVIRYHLGMAQLAAGQRVKARATLEESLTSGASFMGADEARQKLAELKQKTG